MLSKLSNQQTLEKSAFLSRFLGQSNVSGIHPEITFAGNKSITTASSPTYFYLKYQQTVRYFDISRWKCLITLQT